MGKMSKHYSSVEEYLADQPSELLETLEELREIS
jgi:hypothetical protein